MDFNKTEALEIEKTVNDADVALRELGELELALVGGGVGDPASSNPSIHLIPENPLSASKPSSRFFAHSAADSGR